MSIYSTRALFHKYFVAMKYRGICFFVFILSKSPSLTETDSTKLKTVFTLYPFLCTCYEGTLNTKLSVSTGIPGCSFQVPEIFRYEYFIDDVDVTIGCKDVILNHVGIIHH